MIRHDDESIGPDRIAPGRIRLLSEATINRIAAGEVIERPAAAVKELVENALDARRARASPWRSAGGGIDRIEVVDDGIGMAQDELALAVQRHATSKLADDSLERIATLGFRGEALPSIGAAARLSITSRPAGAAHAARDRGGGRRGGRRWPRPPGPAGTRVVVERPVLRHAGAAQIPEEPAHRGRARRAALRRLALAAPAVAFRLESDGRIVFDLPAQDRARPASPPCSAPTPPRRWWRSTGERDGMTLTGFVAAPTVTRATAAGQALAVNGRPVADPVLRTALRVAFRDVIAAGRHPVAALYLESAARGAGRERASGEDGTALPRRGRGARLRDRHDRPRAGRRRGQRGADGQAGAAPDPFAPELSRPDRPRRIPGFAEPRLPLAGAPAARMLASPRRTCCPIIRWARRSRRCSTPTSSPWPATAAWCWSTSTPRMSG